MKRTVKTMKRILSIVLMGILILNMCCYAFCMERSHADAGNAIQQNTGKQASVTIPKGLTPEVASEYLKVVKDVCKKYGPERLYWRDDDLVPCRVGFCGGMFVNLDGDDVPDMVLASRKEDGEARNGAEPMNKSGHGAAELPTWLLKVILPSKEPMIADTDVS